MKVKVIKTFIDKIENITRKKGDVFTISKERFDEINSSKFGKFVEEVEEKPKVGGKNASRSKKLS